MHLLIDTRNESTLIIQALIDKYDYHVKICYLPFNKWNPNSTLTPLPLAYDLSSHE